MAAVAHRRGVCVFVAPFETWTAPLDLFDLAVSAQAWHWVDQNIGPTAAADALRPGGRLALPSNGYNEVSLRDELDAVYRKHAPQIVAKTFVLGRHAPTLRAHTLVLLRPADALVPSRSGRSGGSASLPATSGSTIFRRTATTEHCAQKCSVHCSGRSVP
jgi:SAM-dependent methyltransferase